MGFYSVERGRISLTWKALALLENVLERGLEEAVAHLVAVSVVVRQVLEADLLLAVAVPLLRREPPHGVRRRRDERRRHRDLVLGAGRDVEARLPHDWHVQVVHQGHLQALGALVIVAVVERLDVEQHRVPVVLARLRTLQTI